MIVPANCSVASDQVMKLIPLSNSQVAACLGSDLKRGGESAAPVAAEKRENREAMSVAATRGFSAPLSSSVALTPLAGVIVATASSSPKIEVSHQSRPLWRGRGGGRLEPCGKSWGGPPLV
jgi:hypothetical protein